MKIFTLRSHFHIPRLSPPSSSSSSSKPIKISPSHVKSPKHPSKTPINLNHHHHHHPLHLPPLMKLQTLESQISKNSRTVIMGTALSVGIFLVLFGIDDHQKALALGPEGPLMEEFWDNVRRYALYALTVSTGAIYTVFQPILELLKNPISAILVLAILGGGIFIVSQVLSAMVGVTEFNYDYGY